MNQVLDFTIPQWFEFDGLELLKVQFVPESENQALVLVGENLDGQKMCQPTIRIYLAEKVGETFECTKELDAILFSAAAEAEQFAENFEAKKLVQLLVSSINYKRSFT